MAVSPEFLAFLQEQLAPPAEGEVYLHELEGFAVRLPDQTPLGLVSAVYELPAGLMWVGRTVSNRDLEGCSTWNVAVARLCRLGG